MYLTTVGGFGQKLTSEYIPEIGGPARGRAGAKPEELGRVDLEEIYRRNRQTPKEVRMRADMTNRQRAVSMVGEAPGDVLQPGDVRTPDTMRVLEATLQLLLTGERYRPSDAARLQLRKRALIDLFSRTAPWDAADLHARLAFLQRGDALAKSFHYRLATPTRRMLLEILRRRSGPPQLHGPESAVAMTEASRRGLRSAYDAVHRDCAGRRVLLRLTRAPLDPARELRRLQDQLAAAQRSGDRDRVAQATCELADFRWRSWFRRIGYSRLREQYETLMERVLRTQGLLDRELWWLGRWRCQTWPSDVRQPDSVKQRCREQEQRVARLRATLASLEQQRQGFENRILLG